MIDGSIRVAIMYRQPPQRHTRTHPYTPWYYMILLGQNVSEQEQQQQQKNKIATPCSTPPSITQGRLSHNSWFGFYIFV